MSCLKNLLLLLVATSVSSQSGGFSASIKQFRLVGKGSGPHEGNVQVRQEGSLGWSYICDDGFGFDEADLICGELGFEGADRFTKNNHFGQNTPEWRRSTQTFLQDCLNCSPNDTSYKEPDCIATEIAGVECRRTESNCPPGEFPCRDSSTCILRNYVCNGVSDCPDDSDEADDLCSDVSVARVARGTRVNIPGAVLGPVEVKYNGTWGAMCDDRASEKEAKVICRSMGYGDGWAVGFTDSYLGESDAKIIVRSSYCVGTEQWLGQCPDIIWGTVNCRQETEDFGVFCYNEGLEVRLAGNGSPNKGRVEMKMAGQWGSVCDSGFDIFDAQVICRMLGYEGDSVAHRGSGSGTGPVWSLRLDCLGGERDVEGCRVRIVDGTCPSSNTAGVTCSRRPGQVDAALKAVLGQAECGVPEDASNQFLTNLGKVRGGFAPSRFDTPWLVSLRDRREAGGTLRCGGSIISEDFVVTAAHCLDTVGRLNLVMIVGDYNSDFDEDSEEVFQIDKTWTHEYEDEYAFNDNDIALLKVERKNGRGIRFGPRVKPICLPSVKDSYEHLSKCTVVGWGPTFFSGEPQSRPREAETDILPDDVCEEPSGGPSNYTSSMACAGRFSTQANACRGDSGGPLACPDAHGKQTLYGVVSTGLGCGFSTSADTYVRVSKFVDWILDKIQRSSRSSRFGING